MNYSEKKQPKGIMITGVAHGLGNVVARDLAVPEHQMALVSRVKDHRSESLITICREKCRDVEGYYGDLKNERPAREIVEKALRRFPRLDVLIHCVGPIKYSREFPPSNDDFLKMIEGNVITSLNMIRSVQESMIKNRFGRIILFGFSGLDSQLGFTRMAAYAAAKESLMALARSSARQLIRHGITLNVISPGIVAFADEKMPDWINELKTRIPMEAFCKPEDILGAVKWLISSEAHYVTGRNIKITGGLHI